MPDDPDPPRKFYQLKPREFEAVNAVPPRADDSRREPRPDPGPGLGDNGRITVEEHFRAAQMGGPVLKKSRSAAENDVHAILRDNHTRAEAAGLNKLTPKPTRKSKRLRDYLVLLLGGNVALLMAFRLQPIFAGAGLVLFNVGLAWIMWVVMDDY